MQQRRVDKKCSTDLDFAVILSVLRFFFFVPHTDTTVSIFFFLFTDWLRLFGAYRHLLYKSVKGLRRLAWLAAMLLAGLRKRRTQEEMNTHTHNYIYYTHTVCNNIFPIKPVLWRGFVLPAIKSLWEADNQAKLHCFKCNLLSDGDVKSRI